MKPFHFLVFAPRHTATVACRILGALTLAHLLQFVPTQFSGVYAQTPPSGRLQFDPLTPEERELATRLAEDNARVKQLRGEGRQRLISVELATVKTGAQNDAGTRHAEVLYYRYVGNQGVLALVDLGQRSVREVVRISGDAVPLAAEEVNEAVALALQNQTLIKLLGTDYQRYQVATRDFRAGQPNQVEALRVLASSPRDPCYRHRCVSLLFRQGETFLTGTSVIVDLTSQNTRVEQPARTRAPIRRRRR
jgi:hypothetical protein